MRAVRCLVLLAVLLPALPVRADLSEADGMIGITAQGVGWALRFPAQGYTLSHERHRRDGRGQYYMFTNDRTGLNASFFIEPAEKCPSALACREQYWRDRHPSMAKAQAVHRFERNGFALIEFLVPVISGHTLNQFHMSGHLVRDGYWVDMHLSKVLYTPSDRQLFLDFIDALVIQPKGQ